MLTLFKQQTKKVPSKVNNELIKLTYEIPHAPNGIDETAPPTEICSVFLPLLL